MWQGTVAAVELVQIALITHALGLTEYGRFALALAFVALVGGFFEARVGIAATTHGAQALSSNDYRAAAGVFRLAYLIDFCSGACALIVVAAFSPFVGPGLVGEDGTALLLLCSLTLVGRTLQTSSVAVLRLLDRFRLAAVSMMSVELFRLALVVLALAIEESLLAVAAALIVARLTGGLVTSTAAARAFGRASQGLRLVGRTLGALAREERRRMLTTVFHTNLIAYAKTAQVQGPTLLLGAIAGATETGLYKIGTAVAVIIAKIADPATAALLPRFSRLWHAGKLGELRRLVGHATLVSVPAVALAFAMIVVLREPILEFLGGGSAGKDAGTVLIFAAAAQASYAAVFWRQSLLLAAGRVKVVSAVWLPAAALQIALVAALAPGLGATGAAVALFVSTTLISVVLTTIALRVLRPGAAEALGDTTGAASGGRELKPEGAAASQPP